MSAELLMLIAGMSAFLLTLHWVRGRQLREKYAVMWVLVALLVLLCGIFPRAIMTLADRAHLSYATAVLFISLAAIYVFSFTVSVSLTSQYRRNIRLTQEVALLEQRLKQVEDELRGVRGAPENRRTAGALES